MSASIVRAERIEFESFARVCELHPDFLDRLVALGLLEAAADEEGRRWFERRQVAEVYRIQRLRTGLRLSYSAIAVVAPLLDRLDLLEEEVLRLRAERAAEISIEGSVDDV